MVVRGTFSKGLAISAMVMHMHCSMSDARQWHGQMDNMKDNIHLKSNVTYSSDWPSQAYLEKGDEHGQ
jgi:hypothetical protein